MPVQYLRRAVQLLSEVQGKDAATGQDTGYIQTKAAEGVQGRGSALPHFDKVQASFGQHDLSHVQAYTGSQAKQASESIGAEAYATGSKIAFADSNPSLHTVAHEAAHIVQQQAGVQLKGGVGEAGDPYERQADAVADAVVQGKSADGILINNNSNQTSSGTVQRKLVVNDYEYSNAHDLTNEFKKRLYQDYLIAMNALLPDSLKLTVTTTTTTIGKNKKPLKKPLEIRTVDDDPNRTLFEAYLTELIADPKTTHTFTGKNLTEVFEKLATYMMLRDQEGDSVNPNNDYRSFLVFLYELLRAYPKT